jgi:hypothetical protein
MCAGASLVPGGTLGGFRGSGGGRQLILSQNKDRLDSGLSYLNLPQSICNAARQLLPQVVDAFGQAEVLMQVSPATVAAIIYIAARQEGRALSLGTAASAMDVAGPDVYREFRWGGRVGAESGELGRCLSSLVVRDRGLRATTILLALGRGLRWLVMLSPMTQVARYLSALTEKQLRRLYCSTAATSTTGPMCARQHRWRHTLCT